VFKNQGMDRVMKFKTTGCLFAALLFASFSVVKGAHAQSLKQFLPGEVASASDVNGNFEYLHKLAKELQNQVDFVQVDCTDDETSLKTAMEQGHTRIQILGGRCEAGTATAEDFDPSYGYPSVGMYEIEGVGETKPVLYADNAAGRYIGGANARMILSNLSIETGLATFSNGFLIIRDSDINCMQARQTLPGGGVFHSVGLYALGASVDVIRSSMTNCSYLAIGLKNANVRIVDSTLTQAQDAVIHYPISADRSSMAFEGSTVTKNFRETGVSQLLLYSLNSRVFAGGSTFNGGVRGVNSDIFFTDSNITLTPEDTTAFNLANSELHVRVSGLNGGAIYGDLGTEIWAEYLTEFGGLELGHRGFAYFNHVPLNSVNLVGQGGTQLVIGDDQVNTHSSVTISGFDQIEFVSEFLGSGISIDVPPRGKVSMMDGKNNLAESLNLSVESMLVVTGSRTNTFDDYVNANVACSQSLVDIGDGFICAVP
jgi:hypothetical protein